MGWQDFEYAEAVHRIATYLVPIPNQVDALGNLQDDYVSELCIEALLASRTFRSMGTSPQGEASYVYKSLWNYARTRARSRFRRRRFVAQPFESELDPVSLEERAEARESIRKLQKNLDKKSLRVLLELAAAGGNLTEAWEANPQYNRRYFAAVVRKARDAGKKVLQN
jgi:DNA-directed RNA polymerase specialized sigma24 family protein